MPGAVIHVRPLDRATGARTIPPACTESSWRDTGRGGSSAADERLAEAKVQLMQRVSEQLVRILHSEQLMDEIMSIVLEETRADRGYVCLLGKDGSPSPVISRGLAPGQPVRISRTVLRRLLDERAGVLIEQTQVDDNGDNGDDELESLRSMSVVSTLCAPLWIADQIIGFISLDSTTPGKSFSKKELEMLLAIGHQAAIGIERGRLAAAAEEEHRVRTYLSKYLDDKIVEQITKGGCEGDPLAPREQIVTVLFSDIVSFTKISEGLDPVQLADFVHEYLTVMTEIIFAHGGTVDKYIGDAIMALFGAPVASPDSPLAAVRAAMAMRERTRDMHPPKGEQGQLRARYGINTGLLVVGNIGSARRVEYTALGDAVNVAARLQTFARPDEICIDEDTYAKAGGVLAVEQLGTIDVKNRSQPVLVYKVLGEYQQGSQLIPALEVWRE